MVSNVPDGSSLSGADRALIHYALASSVIALDAVSARRHADTAMSLGVTTEQLHEALVLVSGLGVHSLMEGSRDLARLLGERGETLPEIDAARAATRDRLLVSASSFWTEFDGDVPGFLDALLRLSPSAFEGFVAYGALPGATGCLSRLQRELISIATDAMPGHRYGPGFALHVRQALRLGANRTQLREVVDLAALTPAAPGVS